MIWPITKKQQAPEAGSAAAKLRENNLQSPGNQELRLKLNIAII
jgi:hypothetical protein